MIIEVENFKKTFYVGFRRKPSHAVRGLSFSVEPGEIFGFLGPNGAGKTTTIKALLGLITPDEGKLSLAGFPSESMGWRAQVGYLPEHPTFYDFLTGRELVTWFGQLSGLGRHEAEKQAVKHLTRVGMGHALDRRLRGYSKGMFQRAGLAQALVGKPKLLILDEPMTGLDPIGRKEIRELIMELRDEGSTVFYSTHILPDVEMTCDRVAIVNQGQVYKTGRLDDILSETTRGVSVLVSGVEESFAKKSLAEHKGSTLLQGRLQVELPDEVAARAFIASATAAGGIVHKFEPHRDDLETIFVNSLGENGEANA